MLVSCVFKDRSALECTWGAWLTLAPDRFAPTGPRVSGAASFASRCPLPGQAPGCPTSGSWQRARRPLDDLCYTGWDFQCSQPDNANKAKRLREELCGSGSWGTGAGGSTLGGPSPGSFAESQWG
eukprot:g22346.t1